MPEGIGFIGCLMITDGGYSKYTLYNEPLGYDINRCWRLHLEETEPGNEGYTGEDERGAKCWERITELTRRLMNTGEVEAVGCSFYSCPYSQGNSWTSVEPAGADSVNAYSESLHRQLGDAGFFEVFGIHDVNGKQIRELENPAKDEVILTEKVAQKFFGGKEPRGRLVNTGELDGTPVLAVAPTIRENDFEPATPTFYIKASGSTMEELFEWYRPSSLEYSLRMKRDMTQTEMEEWLASLGERLTSGNIYVNAVTGFKDDACRPYRLCYNGLANDTTRCRFLVAECVFWCYRDFLDAYTGTPFGNRIAYGCRCVEGADCILAQCGGIINSVAGVDSYHYYCAQFPPHGFIEC